MKNVGVVDSEYIVHLGLPTLGGPNGNEASDLIRTRSVYLMITVAQFSILSEFKPILYKLPC